MSFQKGKGIREKLKAKPQNWMMVTIILLAILIGMIIVFNGFGIISLNAGMVSLSHEIWGNSGLLNSGDILIKFLEKNPDNEDAWKGLAYFWLLEKKYDQALDAWKEAGITARELVYKGEDKQNNSQYEEAIIWYDLAIKMDPEYGDAYYFLGWMYNLTGNQDLAHQNLIKAEGLPLDQVNHSDLYYQLGKVAGSLGPVGESSALDYYTQAIVDNHFTYPFQAGDAHFQRAMIYRKKGWNERAIAELNYVITEYPTHYSAWVRLGYIAWDVEGDLSTAEYYFTQAIKLDDERLAAYFGLAHALQEAGMRSEAEDTYNKILTIDPQNQDALERLQQLGK